MKKHAATPCVQTMIGCLLIIVLGADAPAATELATLTQAQWGDNLLALEHGTSNPGTDNSAASDSYTDGGASFSGNATATASFGSLGVSTNASVTNGTFLVHRARGSAGFTDEITVIPDDPLLDGTEGMMDLTFDVTGTSATSGDGQVTVDLFVIIGDPDLLELPDLTFEQGGFTHTTAPFAFTYGQPFDLTVTLGVDAIFVSVLDPVTGTATGDFANTVTVTGVNLFDGTGAPDIASNIVATSGTAYPVPEPASMGLLLIGASICGRRPRRPQQA